MDLTVIVCSLDGADRIRCTLESLRAQRTKRSFEILVVDDGSSDSTGVIAESLDVRVLRHPENRGIGAARRTGFTASAGEFVAFTDDDCIPDPEWIDALFAGVSEHPEGSAWGGLTRGAAPSGIVARYLTHNNPWLPLPTPSGDGGTMSRLVAYMKRNCVGIEVAAGPVHSLVTSNVLLRRTDVEDVGGFDERFTFGGEEEELFARLRERGRVLYFVPEAIVMHRYKASVREMALRSFGYGSGNARLFFKRSRGIPTVYPLPIAMLILSFFATQSVLGFMSLCALPIGFYLRWLVLSLRTKSAEPLVYPFLQLIQEASCNAAWIVYGLSIASRGSVHGRQFARGMGAVSVVRRPRS